MAHLFGFIFWNVLKKGLLKPSRSNEIFKEYI